MWHFAVYFRIIWHPLNMQLETIKTFFFFIYISDLPSHVISKAGRSSSITRVSAQSKAAGARVNRGFLIAAVILEEFTAFQSSTTGSRTRRENAVQSL